MLKVLSRPAHAWARFLTVHAGLLTRLLSILVHVQCFQWGVVVELLFLGILVDIWTCLSTLGSCSLELSGALSALFTGLPPK